MVQRPAFGGLVGIRAWPPGSKNGRRGRGLHEEGSTGDGGSLAPFLWRVRVISLGCSRYKGEVTLRRSTSSHISPPHRPPPVRCAAVPSSRPLSCAMISPPELEAAGRWRWQGQEASLRPIPPHPLFFVIIAVVLGSGGGALPPPPSLPDRRAGVRRGSALSCRAAPTKVEEQREVDDLAPAPSPLAPRSPLRYGGDPCNHFREQAGGPRVVRAQRPEARWGPRAHPRTRLI